MRRVAEVHRYELACRLIEAVFDVPRPPDVDPRLLIERLDAEDPGQADKWLAAADAACNYITECCTKGDTHEETDCSRWSATANAHDTTH